MTSTAPHINDAKDSPAQMLRSGDAALIGILASDFFGAVAGAIVYMTMVWWVLAQGASALGITMLVLSIFAPTNIGVIFSGVAVARFGARKLLLFSKSLAVVGAVICAAMLATDMMTLWSLALLAAIVYGAMAPSMTADVSRAPAITRLAQRKLAGFHATNGSIMVTGQLGGLVLGGYLADSAGAAVAVSFAAVLVVISLLTTWASFPRDRVKPPSKLQTSRQIIDMTNDVLARLDGKKIGLVAIFVTAGYIVVAEGFAEVLLPLALRAADLPASELSFALGVSVVASIIAMLAAQAAHERFELKPSLAAIGVATVALLVIATSIGGWWALVIAVSATTAGASASATMTFTTMQLAMPVSLQAQAAGLWQSFVLTSSVVVIFLCGLISSYGFATLLTFTILATLASFWRVRDV